MNNICYIIQEYIGYILFALAYSKIKDVNGKVGKFGQFQNLSKPMDNHITIQFESVPPT